MALRREGFGVMVSEHRNFTLAAQAKWAIDAGADWISLHGHAGSNPPEEGHPGSDYISVLRHMGYKSVGCWGTFGPDSDPIHTAWAANGAIHGFGYDFYIANLETPKSEFSDRKFLTELMKYRSTWKKDFAIWLSTEISNQRDWAAWFKKGEIVPDVTVATAWLPQCYTSVKGKEGETPKQAHYWGIRKENLPASNNGGSPRYLTTGQIKPTVSEYQDAHKPPAEYAAEWLDSNLGPGGQKLGPGFSIYLGETTTQSEYVEFGRQIKLHGWAA